MSYDLIVGERHDQHFWNGGVWHLAPRLVLLNQKVLWTPILGLFLYATGALGDTQQERSIFATDLAPVGFGYGKLVKPVGDFLHLLERVV